MAYLGNAPARSFISFERQVFTIVNSQTAYTLSHSVNNENDIRLVINNIVQEPGSGKAYTASGTTLTLSAALTNGTDEMYCVFLGRATATNAPGAGSVGTSQLAADAVTNAKIADDAISDEQLDPTVITGHTQETGIEDDDTILFSDTSASGALKKISKSAFLSGVGGANTPIVRAVPSGNQSISSSTNTTVVFDSEVLDTDSAFASNTFTVPSGKAGKYYIGVNLITDTYDGTLLERLQIKKNTSTDVGYNNTKVYGDEATIHVFCIVDLSVGDTINANYYSYQHTAIIKGNSEYANGSSIDIFKLI